MKINGKVIKVTRKGGWYSLRLSVVRNFRNNEGKPRNETLISFPTIRSNQVKKPEVQQAFWKRCDADLLRLMLTGAVMRNDIEAIKKKFEKHIPRPLTAPAKVEAPAPKSAAQTIFEKYPLLRSN
jgi:hypothetical protein